MANSKYEYVKSFEVDDEVFMPNLIVVRIDGHNFRRFSQFHEFEKPNDERALNLMNSCAIAVLEEYPDIVFSYGFSDEYSFILKRTSKFYQRRARRKVMDKPAINLKQRAINKQKGESSSQEVCSKEVYSTSNVDGSNFASVVKATSAITPLEVTNRFTPLGRPVQKPFSKPAVSPTKKTFSPSTSQKLITQYVEKSYAKYLFVLEDHMCAPKYDNNPKKLADDFLFKECHQVPYFGICPSKFFETILIETKSVEIFEVSDKPGEIDFCKIKIKKILTIDDWGGNPNFKRNFQNKSMYPTAYNYWDYQRSWKKYLNRQNSSTSMSWFFYFEEHFKPVIPNDDDDDDDDDDDHHHHHHSLAKHFFISPLSRSLHQMTVRSNDSGFGWVVSIKILIEMVFRLCLLVN